jgi:epoxyqueuosine reductase
MTSLAAGRAARVKELALEVGFDVAGVAAADAPRPLDHFAGWVRAGHAANMTYLTDQIEKRSDVRVPFAWVRSLVCVALQYDSPLPYSTTAPRERGWISRYAWGDDYHDVVGDLLRRLVDRLRAELGPFQCRAFVDTGPIVERAYAFASGLGWWGKNTCLIHPTHGSWLFLGELLTDLDLTSDEPQPDRCGSCSACLSACPTGALVAPRVLDARRCISYLTIEHRGDLPEDLRPALGRHVFGCDICQDVCPWNRRRRHKGPACFEPRLGLFAPDLSWLAALDKEGFRRRFRRSAVRRAKWRGLMRNVALALDNRPDAAHE